MKPIALLLILVVTLSAPSPALAYLKYGALVGGAVVDVRWRRPVPYFITERDVSGVTAVQLRDAVGRAFATWQAVPTAAVQSQFQGYTIAPPGLPDDGRVRWHSTALVVLPAGAMAGLVGSYLLGNMGFARRSRG